MKCLLYFLRLLRHIKVHPFIILSFLRKDGTAYRIVGFEVDPRSVSTESLQLKTEKDPTSIKGKAVESGAKCVFPKDVKVAEIKRKESETMYTYILLSTGLKNG